MGRIDEFGFGRHLAADISREKVGRLQIETRRVVARMSNFFLGAVAGALIAGILTITAARQPEFQAKLGLVAAPLPITPAAASNRPPPPQCRPDPVGTASGQTVQEILFNRQRFWSVAP